MVAKVMRSNNLFGTLSYNNLKVEKDNGEILLVNKMIETADGKYSVSQLSKSFEPYLFANRNTEKHTLHISLNPDPRDKVSDEQYREIAQKYMDDMGFGNQPYVVFKHTDIERNHIHIVSVCIDEEGKKISDKFERVRSMKACRELEKTFGLISALHKESTETTKIFKQVQYKKGNVKSQIATVVRNLSSHYQFTSLGEYNALLSLYNITAEKLEGELHGKLQKGLLYFPLDDKGKKVGSPFKASLFGENAGIHAVEKYIDSCKITMNDKTLKNKLRDKIAETFQYSKNEKSFRNNLLKQGMDMVIRKTDTGRIYGMTFIDHPSKTVWNGSRLGKEFSANVFNNKWNNFNNQIQAIEEKDTFFKTDTNHTSNLSYAMESLFESFSGIHPSVQNEDHEETNFTNRMLKKKLKKKR